MMCLLKFYIFIYCGYIISNCCALNCRSDGGPKENDLKRIYMNCVKKHDTKNTNDTHSSQDDHDWRDSRKRQHNHNWDNRNDRKGSREDRLGGRNRDGMGDRDFGLENERGNNRDDNAGDRYNNMRRNTDNTNYRDKTMSHRDRNSPERFGRHEHGVSARDGFLESDEFEGDIIPSYSTVKYRSFPHPPRRFKRERRMEMNPSHRSYPNSESRGYGHEDSDGSTEKNSSDDTAGDDDSKKCVLHCFLEELKMIGENSFPDKYLVTNIIMKGVKNEDLRDFLEESIEECFQILNNENTEDKCEFSSNLMMCLSEKGRSNCDDWKEDMRF